MHALMLLTATVYWPMEKYLSPPFHVSRRLYRESENGEEKSNIAHAFRSSLHYYGLSHIRRSFVEKNGERKRGHSQGGNTKQS